MLGAVVLSVGAVEAKVVAVEVAVESRWSEFVGRGSAVADVRVCCGAYGPFCVVVVDSVAVQQSHQGSPGGSG